ncbi:MAG TPA: tripartite tricarboxylate transporter permease [Candidatus Competibacteraceae bacterium]|nr:tripartite tricarboxylate transporter permease [Candidatus Competibacteraceae bacterium]
MDLINNLALGFSVALTIQNILYCLLGTIVGTLVGVLPGLGPLATIAMLLPITFGLEPTTALIMLAGIYYGAQYGGSTTAILVNLPGETSAVVTALDGYQMARQGKAGEALMVAALGSFFAGTVGTLLIAAFAPPLSEIALKFGPAEYFSLMVLGLIAAVVLAHGSVIKAIAMILVGLLLGLVGTDVTSGDTRYTFGLTELADGIDFVVVAMGLFGIAEVISNVAGPEEERKVQGRLGMWKLSREDFRRAAPAAVRGTFLGSILGILPGGGAVLGSFSSYMLEKKLSKQPQRFGKGAIEGVAGPEAANNAGAQTSFIPMLTLGLPSNGVMALMIGALTIHNIQPGPQVMTGNPSLFWGLIASMWIGNLLLVILNLPLIGVWIKLLTVKYRLLYPAIVVLCSIGVYSVNNSEFHVLLMALFGMLGYLFIKLECEPAPLLLGFVLGPMMEENLRRAMTLAKGDPTVFVTRPLSLVLLLVAVGLLVLMLAPALSRRREQVFEEFHEV